MLRKSLTHYCNLSASLESIHKAFNSSLADLLHVAATRMHAGRERNALSADTLRMLAGKYDTS